MTLPPPVQAAITELLTRRSFHSNPVRVLVNEAVEAAIAAWPVASDREMQLRLDDAHDRGCDSQKPLIDALRAQLSEADGHISSLSASCNSLFNSCEILRKERSAAHNRAAEMAIKLSEIARVCES